MATAERTRAWQLTRLEWGSLGVVALLGAMCLPMPFTGDQALFTVGAREISDGAVLYRDFWDQKQPAIYVFYLVGGKIFGFNEVGVHLLELAYWMAFSWFLIVTLRDRFERRWVAVLGPLVVVGAYYLAARPFLMTQVEILVAFPLYATWWFTQSPTPSTPRGKRRLALSGLAGASVVLFKHLYVVVALFFWVHALLRMRKDHSENRSKSTAGALGWIATGFAPPLLLVTFYLAVYGQLGRVWWTYFTYSPNTVRLYPRQPDDLYLGVRSFVVRLLPLLVLAAYALLRGFRRRADPLIIDMAAWLVLGAFLVLIQSWWAYQLMFFVAPIGILALFGVDELVTTLASRGRALTVAVVGILAVATLRSAFLGVQRAERLVRNDLALTVTGRAAFREAYAREYRLADDSVGFLLQPDAEKGDIYVFGDPTYLLRSGRDQAIAIHGWSPQFNDSRTWKEVTSDLAAASPPYIMIDAFSSEIMNERSPETAALVEANYRPVRSDAEGVTWYQRRAQAEPP